MKHPFAKPIAAVSSSVRQLEASGYGHDVLTISITSQWRFDNDPPFPPLADFVAAWNKLGLKPRLRLTTVTDAMQRLEQAWGSTAPEYGGEWTDWWANGTASAPREVAASRTAKRLLAAAQSPFWGPAEPGTQQTIDELYRDLCLFDEHTWGSSLSVAKPYSLDTQGQFTEKSLLAYRPMARAEWLLSQRVRTQLAGEGEGLFLINPSPARYSGWVRLIASCLRDDYRSLQDPRTGAKMKLCFEPGVQPWGRPRGPEDLSREDISATFSDNAPNKIAKFWVEHVDGRSVQRLQLSRQEIDTDTTSDGGAGLEIKTDTMGWPTAAVWTGMKQPLFLPGVGDFVAVRVNGFAPRHILADIRGQEGEAQRPDASGETRGSGGDCCRTDHAAGNGPHASLLAGDPASTPAMGDANLGDLEAAAACPVHVAPESPVLGRSGDLLYQLSSAHGCDAASCQQRRPMRSRRLPINCPARAATTLPSTAGRSTRHRMDTGYGSAAMRR